MRKRIIVFLKQSPLILAITWNLSRFILRIVSVFIPVRDKTMLFSSFGGRNFDDSPKALYDEVLNRDEFSDWTLIWAFVEPEKFELPRGEKIKIDTFSFFHALLYSKVWISNSGMDRGIRINRKKTIKVETWHGSPLKKTGGDEHQNSMLRKSRNNKPKNLDADTIRCAQSDYDRNIYQRLMNATQESFLMCGLPRNDILLRYTSANVQSIKQKLNIPTEKEVILYTPTYREYLIDEQKDTYLAPPMDLQKWEQVLGKKYVLLVRAHYAVSAALKIEDNEFVKDVSRYPILNELYYIADLMISDYSSTFFDYSILDRPMFCFAYDLEEYMEKRGLYVDLHQFLPCSIDRDEDTLLRNIQEMSKTEYASRVRAFHEIYTPHEGNASRIVVDKILERLR